MQTGIYAICDLEVCTWVEIDEGVKVLLKLIMV